MAAPEAGIRPDGKFLVVVRSHFIARERQIVILVYDADIDARGTKLIPFSIACETTASISSGGAL